MSKHPLHHFETFLTVAELGSFTAAAKQLGISKAAVSQTIRTMETALKTPLFLRTTRSIRLTEEGELLRAQSLKIKAELDLANDLITGFNTAPRGHLRISCNPCFGEALLVNIIKSYQAKYPGVSIEVISEERMPDMAKENIDIVYGINWPAPLDIVARKIGQTRYTLCASPDYLKQHGTPRIMDDLQDHHYIPHAGRGKENRINALKKQYHGVPHSSLASNNAQFMKICALNGLGIVQVHDYVVQAELAAGELVEVLPDAFLPATDLYVYYQKHRYVQPKIKTFVTILFEMLQS
jgi:DNA-binding transcriptional LysR family regulator